MGWFDQFTTSPGQTGGPLYGGAILRGGPGGNTGVAGPNGGAGVPRYDSGTGVYYVNNGNPVMYGGAGSAIDPAIQGLDPQQPSAGGSGSGDWIGDALSAVQSTDDPNYWRQVIGQHGDLNNPAAQAYWIDRINRGDGSALVKNGSLATYGGGRQVSAPPGGPGDGAMMPANVYQFGNGISVKGDTTNRSGNYASTPYQLPSDFKAPTADEAAQDPGYQFGLDQSLKALQSSAAAKGMLLTGNTLKGLTQNANDYASTKYGDVYNRALNTYQTNVGNQLNAYNANVQAKLGQGNLDLGFTQAGNQFALGKAGLELNNKQAMQSYDLGLRGNALGYYTADQNYALGQGQLGLGYYNAGNQNALGWANYGLNANQQQFFQDYQFPITTGYGAASQMGQYAGQYGTNGQNNAYGFGNAQAAGTMGSGNAWANGGANAAGYMGGAFMSAYGQQPNKGYNPYLPGRNVGIG